MSDLIQTLEEIRNDYAHVRNAYLYPPPFWVEKYTQWAAEAERKIDAINAAICAVQQDEVAHG